ncbi:MAG: type II toxin-antitoxin system Phd/YefM family antitoxin [Pseudonocardia sp.]|nr:type II toxin-antitoxin system Phd/YefM family antitoxin [Pseudonocardia sp.]
MAEQVNIYDAKTNLSKLIERVEAGEEIVIARSGRPVAHLVPVPRRPNRSPGSLRGRITIAPDYDASDAELADLMEDGATFPDEPGPQ